jgi:Lon protease-like protein
MLSIAIPLFPLPNVVLFPGVFLPLHIFEARYRTMVRDVLASERMIGISLSKPGWHQEGESQPAIYPIGCVGLVTHVEQLDDGRYNIVLRGVEKFRIVGERDGRPYRVAQVEYLAEQMTSADHEVVRQQRERLEHLLTSADTPDLPFPSTLSDEEVVNALAQYLDLEPIERQALLERAGVAERCAALIDLLEMKSMANGHPPDRGLVH